MVGLLRSAWMRDLMDVERLCTHRVKKSNVDQELTPANRLFHGTSKNRSNNMSLQEALSTECVWALVKGATKFRAAYVPGVRENRIEDSLAACREMVREGMRKDCYLVEGG